MSWEGPGSGFESSSIDAQGLDRFFVKTQCATDLFDNGEVTCLWETTVCFVIFENKVFRMIGWGYFQTYNTPSIQNGLILR